MHDALAPSTLRIILGTSHARTTEVSVRPAAAPMRFESPRERYPQEDTISDVGSTIELATLGV